jgi:hypothetical protein
LQIKKGFVFSENNRGSGSQGDCLLLPLQGFPSATSKRTERTSGALVAESPSDSETGKLGVETWSLSFKSYLERGLARLPAFLSIISNCYELVQQESMKGRKY